MADQSARGTARITMALACAAACAAFPTLRAKTMPPGAARDGGSPAPTKRLAPAAVAGTPPARCQGAEGFVLQVDRRAKVTSAMCGGHPRAWVAQRDLRPERDAPGRGDGIHDVLDPGPLANGERFSSGPYCHDRGRELQWVAIYRWAGRRSMSGRDGIRAAWVVESGTLRFVPASAALRRRVRCSVEGDS